MLVLDVIFVLAMAIAFGLMSYMDKD